MGKSGFFFFFAAIKNGRTEGLRFYSRVQTSLSALMKAPGNGKAHTRACPYNGRMAEKNTGEFGLIIIVYSR